MAGVEPIYGLAVIGLVDPNRLLRNSTAQHGDRLVLTTPLGIGIFSTALKRGPLSNASYATTVESATQITAVSAELPDIAGVHAVTDVTAFGLLGHALKMCRGAAQRAVAALGLGTFAFGLVAAGVAAALGLS